jgi:hypothetical protein
MPKKRERKQLATNDYAKENQTIICDDESARELLNLLLRFG